MNRKFWTDDLLKEYFDSKINTTLHEICALSGRTKADVKAVLMQSANQPETHKQENCECGIDEKGRWSETVFDRFGCGCG